MATDISKASQASLIGATLQRSPRLALASILAAILTFVMMRQYFAAVWHTGAYFDTDDTMHMVQVRALLAGQNWFDMTVPRLDPPLGTFMHWSRLVDIGPALLVEAFRGATDVETAERLARLLFPFALLVGLYRAMAWLAAELLGFDASIPAVAATLLSGAGVIQFMPGRIDHHAPQIVLLVAMLGSAVAALDPARAKWAALTGALGGLSLAINLENLPFIAVLAAGLIVLWIRDGEPMRRALAWYAAGTAAGLVVCFAATVAPRLYVAPVCDAFGAAHLGAGLIGAAGCGAAVLAGARLSSVAARAAAATAVGVAALAFLALAYPACLHDPFAAVDPLVRELWLAHVEESLPLTTLLRRDPSTALFSAVPVALGLCGCLFAACRATTARQRAGYALVALVVATGLALAFWQVRVFSSITAIALSGGLYAAFAMKRHWQRRGREALASLSLALLFPFTATAVGLVLPAEAAPPAARTVGRDGATADQCLAPSAFAPLHGLSGTVIAPVDTGSYLLVHTDLAVFAAAFHRDNDGNRFAFDAMLAPSDAAARKARKRGATYVLICPGLPETRILADRAPGSLAADLLAGRVPAWLDEVKLADTPIRLFRVRADRP